MPDDFAFALGSLLAYYTGAYVLLMSVIALIVASGRWRFVIPLVGAGLHAAFVVNVRSNADFWEHFSLGLAFLLVIAVLVWLIGRKLVRHGIFRPPNH